MGGTASPFIDVLYLSWCEYCYMTKVVKTDYTLANFLSYNCRYLDDICTINLQNFGDSAKDIYDNSLLLEGSTCSYKQDTFLDLYIRVVDHKFITGIYHKVDDFNFEVICYPFPQSNVLPHTGSTLYSEGSFVRRFFSPKPFEVAMVRRTFGPKVLYSEVPLLRNLLCSEDSIFGKAFHYMDSMLRRFFSPKFI